MRRLGALLVLALSACADGGVVIEVKPTDPNVTSVRLFLGSYDRTEGATLELPTGSTANGVIRSKIDGVTYFPRDANNELDTKAVKAGGTARFVLVRDGVTDLGAVIAVGYAGNQISEVATLFDVHLPSTRFDQYTLTLARPATPPVAWSKGSPVPPSEATCIGITDPATKDPYSVSYIVTPNDPDCDGLDKDDPAECNNQAWFGKRAASLDEITCLVPQIGTQTCVLGGPECVDGQPPTAGQCAPTQYCVPKTVCGACAGNLDCAEDITTNPTLPPAARSFGIECPLGVANGDTCEDELVLSMAPIDGLECTDAAIADAKHGFSDHIDYGDRQIYLKADPGCQLRLVVKGKAPDASMNQIGLMIAVGLSNGRGVAVPILLRVDGNTNTCPGKPVACTFDSSTIGSEILDCATPWSQPVIEPGLAPGGATNVRSPSLTSDELDIWFVTDDQKVWHSSRPSKIAGWSPPVVEQLLSAVAGGGQLTTAARVSPDGLTMYLSGTRGITAGGNDVYMATRPNRGEAWSQLVPAGMINTLRNETGASVDDSGHLLAYSAEVDASPATFSRLFVSSRSATAGTWGSGTMIAGTGTITNDVNPHVASGGKSMYFASDVVGPSFGMELFVMDRTNGGMGPYGAPRRLAALGSAKNDTDPWVSTDQRTIYFASDRGTGMYRIYRATR